MRVLAAVLVAAVLLAGCSGNGGDAAAPPTSSSSSSSGPPPPPAPTSDTLHLLDAPHVATALPSSGSEAVTPVGFANGGQGGPTPQTPVARWTYQVQKPTNVTGGEAHLWVNVKDTMFASDPPGQPACTWRLRVAVGADTTPLVHCINEPAGPINPGTKELVFTLVLDSPIGMEANETITVILERQAFSAAPGNSVDCLSGTAEHDSRVQLRGLKEPLPKA